jgi:23S rRNA (guanosine2251-2'-O)-methyltransferase
MQKAKLKQIPVEPKPPGVLDKLGSGNQGVACLVSETPRVEWSSLKGKSRSIILALDGLEDPQNLGSILRTAWLTQVDAILIPSDRSVSLTPTVAKIASGGAEHVPVEEVSNMGETLKAAKEDGYWIFGLAEQGANKIWDLQMPDRLIWVIGSESSGLRTAIARACDELVNIPQAPSGSSFNASVAAAIALYETNRQSLVKQ